MACRARAVAGGARRRCPAAALRSRARAVDVVPSLVLLCCSVLALALGGVAAAPLSLFVSPTSGSDANSCEVAAQPCASVGRAAQTLASVSAPQLLANVFVVGGGTLANDSAVFPCGVVVALIVDGAAPLVVAHSAWSMSCASASSSQSQLSLSGPLTVSTNATLAVRNVNVSAAGVTWTDTGTLTCLFDAGGSYNASIDGCAVRDSHSAAGTAVLSFSACADVCVLSVAVASTLLQNVSTRSGALAVQAAAVGSSVQMRGVSASAVHSAGFDDSGSTCGGALARIVRVPDVQLDGVALESCSAQCTGDGGDPIDPTTDVRVGGALLLTDVARVVATNVAARNVSLLAANVAGRNVSVGGAALCLVHAAPSAGVVHVALNNVTLRDCRIAVANASAGGEALTAGGGVLVIAPGVQVNGSDVGTLASGITVNVTQCLAHSGAVAAGGNAVAVVGASVSWLATSGMAVGNILSAVNCTGGMVRVEGASHALSSSALLDVQLTALRVTKCAVQAAFVASEQSSVVGGSSAAGGAIALRSSAGPSRVLIASSTFADLQVSVHSSRAARDNIHGGGAIALRSGGSGGLHVELCTFQNLSVVAPDCIASVANIVGGAAMHVLVDVHANVSVASSSFNTLRVVVDGARGDSGVLNVNGGGAAYVHTLTGNATLSFAGASVANALVSVVGARTGTRANTNGGAVAYVRSAFNPQSLAAVRVEDSILSSLIVDVRQNNVSGSSPTGNSNGGGAILVSSIGAARADVIRCSISNASVAADDSAAMNATYQLNGGGCIFLLSETSDADALLTNSTLRAARVSAHANTGASQYNGGAGIFATAITGSVSLDVSGSLLADLEVDATSSSGVGQFNGGGALYANSLGLATVRIAHTIIESASVRASNMRANGRTANGGGAVCANAQGGIALELSSVVFVNVSAAITNNSNPSDSVFSGGGAVLAYSSVNSATLRLVSVSVRNASAHLSNTTTGRDNFAGGGVLYVYAGARANVTLAHSSFSDVALLADSCVTASGDNNNGGGGVYLFSKSQSASNIVSVSSSLFSNVFVSLRSNNASRNNTNGGGALYVNPVGSATVLVSSSAFAGLTVDAQYALAGDVNLNGGAGLFVNPGADALVSLANATLSNVTALCSFSSGSTNWNGGAGVFVAASGTAGVVIAGVSAIATRVECAANIAGNAAPSIASGNKNGGGTLYLLGLVNVKLHVSDTQIVDSSIRADDSSSASSNFIGGGGVYAFAGASANVSFSNFSIHQAFSLCSNASGAAENNNGGAGVYVYSNADANVSWHGGAVNGAAALCDHGVALGSANSNGGGGLYVYSKGNSSATLRQLALSNCSASVAWNRALGNDNLNGGAGVYINPDGSAQVDFVNVTLEGMTVVVDDSVAHGNNSNGGAGLFVSPITGATVSVANCSFANMLVYARRLTAVQGNNANGGAAVYVQSSVDSCAVALQRSVVFSAGVVIANTSAALGSSSSGGGAFYTLSSGSALVVLEEVFVFDAAVSAGGVTAKRVTTGGGAVYAHSVQRSVQLDGSKSRFVRCAVQIELAAPSNGAQAGAGAVAAELFSAGGGAVYLLGDGLNVTNALSARAVVFERCAFALRGGAASGINSTAITGGGALFVNSLHDASVTVSDAVFANCTTTMSGVRAPRNRVAVGGTLFLLSQNASLRADVSNASVADCSVNAETVQCGSTHGAFVGGAAFFAVARANVTVSFSNDSVNRAHTELHGLANGEGPVFAGGTIFVLSDSSSVNLSISASRFTDTSMNLADVSAASLGDIAGACGGAVVFAISNTNSALYVQGSDLMGSSLRAASITSSASAWYVGGGAVLAIGRQQSAALWVAGTRLVSCSVDVAQLQTNATLTTVGGGTLFVAGSMSANAALAGVQAFGNSLALDDAALPSGELIAGGGVISLSALTKCASAVVSLRIDGSNFTGNGVLLSSFIAGFITAGGGTVLLASSVGQQQLNVGDGCTFLNNTVTLRLAIIAAAEMTVGGGAVMLRNQALQETENTIGQVLFAGNSVLALFRSTSSQTASVVGGGALLHDSATPLLLTSAVFVNNSVTGELGAGGALRAVGARVVVTTATFSGNRAQTGGAACIDAPFADTTTLWLANTAAVLGGALRLLSNIHAITNSSFVGNAAGSLAARSGYGGGFHIEQDAVCTLLSCTMQGNEAFGAGGAVLLTSSAVVSVIACNVTGNAAHAVGGGAFFTLVSSTLNISGSTVLQGNVAFGSFGGAICAYDSSVVLVDDSVIAASSASVGAGLYIDSLTSCTLSRTALTGNEAQGSGGAIAVGGQAQLNVSGAQLSGCSALGDGGGLQAFGNASVWLSQVDVRSAYARRVGGGLHVTDEAMVRLSSTVKIENCTATSGAGVAVQGSALLDSSPGSLRIVSCHATTGTGGGMLVQTSGAFVAETDAHGPSIAHIVNCSAVCGGGIAFHPPDNSSFAAMIGVLNASTEGVGLLELEGNRAIGRSGSRVIAPGGGGALYFDLGAASSGDNETDVALVHELLEVVASIENSSTLFIAPAVDECAVYGCVAASTWAGVRVSLAIPAEDADSDEHHASARQGGHPSPAEPASLSAWRGEPVAISLQAVDVFGSNLSTLASGSAAAIAQSCGPQLYVALVHGRSEVSSKACGTGVEFAVGASVVTSASERSSITLPQGDATANLVPCPAGTYLLRGNEADDSSCVVCSPGQYSLQSDSASCFPCPENALCLGGSEVYIASLYWPSVSNAGNLSVVPCPFDYCEHEAEPEHGGEHGRAAATMRSGDASGDGAPPGFVRIQSASTLCFGHRNASVPLCGGCATNYSEWDRSCLPCPSEFTLQRQRSYGVLVAEIVVGLMLMRFLGQHGVVSASGTSGFAMWVFVLEYAELVMLPIELIPRELGILSLRLPLVPRHDFVDYGCPFPVPSGLPQLALVLMMPFVYACALLVSFGVHRLVARCCCASCVAKSRAPTASQAGFCKALLRATAQLFVESSSGASYGRTFILLVINAYESWVAALFGILLCTNAGPAVGSVVFALPAVSCGDSLYASSAVMVGIGLFLLCLGVPIVSAMVLRHFLRTKNARRRESFESVGGMLFHHFADRFYWWESILLLRRAVLVVVFVAVTAKANATVGRTAVTLALLAFIMVQALVRPYRHAVDNMFDLLSQLCIMVVAQCADDLGTNQSPHPADTLAGLLVIAMLIASAIVLLAPTVRVLHVTCRQRVEVASGRSSYKHGSVHSGTSASSQPLVVAYRSRKSSNLDRLAPLPPAGSLALASDADADAATSSL